MKIKIFIVAILIIIVIASIITPKIYADNNEIVSIKNSEPKAGEETKVYLNLENIEGYDLSKIVLSTDIYIEPTLDTADTTLTSSDMTFDAAKKEFTITNIPEDIKTLCVTYTIPQYIVTGTKINLTVTTFEELDSDEQEVKYTNTYEIVVKSEEQNNNENETQNNNNNTLNPSNLSLETSNNSNSKTIELSTTSSKIQSSNGSGNNIGGSSSSETTATYKGSRNNYLTNLAVEGYDLNLEFKKTNNTYFLTVENSVTSLNVTASKEDSTSVVTVSGNTNLKVGVSKVLISVLAENGDTRYYRIYVTREG